jgi:uncharacterized protein YrrD
MRRDINDLQKNIVIKYELQEMEAKLEAKIDGLKEEIMEVLKNFVIEIMDVSKNFVHNVPHTQKVQIASLYLEPNQFVWYQ